MEGHIWAVLGAHPQVKHTSLTHTSSRKTQSHALIYPQTGSREWRPCFVAVQARRGLQLASSITPQSGLQAEKMHHCINLCFVVARADTK